MVAAAATATEMIQPAWNRLSPFLMDGEIHSEMVEWKRLGNVCMHGLQRKKLSIHVV